MSNLRESKDAVLGRLDILLGAQGCTKEEKIAALREVEKAPKRMADQIERHMEREVHWIDEVRK